MDELHNAGFGIWALSHTKFKTIKEKGSTDEDGYMQLTSILSSEYESAFGDIFDATLTGVIDRDTVEKHKEVAGKDKVSRYVTESVRKLYFRETPLIDAGGRFAFGAVPEYMVFDKPNMAADFIKIVEDGMKNSKRSKVSKLPNVTSKTTKNTVEIEEKIDDTGNVNAEDEEQVVSDVEETEIDTTVMNDDDVLEPEFDVHDAVNQIRAKFKTADVELKKAVKKILNGERLSENLPVDTLKELLAVFN